MDPLLPPALAPAPASFEALLETGGPSFMPTQVVVVPTAVLVALGPATRRVIAAFDGSPPERLGLLPQSGGGRYLLLRKELCRTLRLEIGQLLHVVLIADPDPDHIDLPDELLEALSAWPEAEVAYQPLPNAMKRAMARHVAEARQPETRARRAVQLVERLARGGHPFRAVD